jgi:hypothetical protein
MSLFRFRAFLSALAMALLLGSCGHMPVTSMIRLARADLTTTDPTQLRAAVKLPRLLRPRPHGVALRIAVRLANGQEEAQEFKLREVSEPNGVLALHHELGPDTHIFAYRLEQSEAVRLATFRDALKVKQSASGGRGGAITISIRPDACRTGDLPVGAVLVTTYLRTAETGGYVALARDLDLCTINPGQDHAAKIPPCG